MKDLSSYEMEEIIGGGPEIPPPPPEGPPDSWTPPQVPSGPPIAPEGESNDPYEGPNGGRRSK